MNNNKIKRIFSKGSVRYGLILLAGLLLGWLIFSGSPSTSPDHDHAHHGHDHADEPTVWTCSMHPQIRMDEPGLCPLCAMDLIPLQTTGSGDALIDPAAIQLSAEAVALANIQTTIASLQNPVKEMQLYGTIRVDERLARSQTAHVSGRIEQLSVAFIGERVREGQPIATIYSPELLSAQQELIEAVRLQEAQPALLEAVREKLRLWKLTDEQIKRVEQSGKASPLLEITANTSGIVVAKNINQGDYVNTGTVLFDIADLSRVWAVFDAYEADLPFLKVGDRLEYTLQALPGKTFSGQVSFINPILDPATRTAKIRVETANPGLELMPEMYANAKVTAPLKQHAQGIVIPKSAVLWTGKRSIAYVKQQDTETPAYLPREIELGPSLGEAYVVLSGIEEGDEVVTQGVFMIDASAQLAGKKSMMNDEAGQAVTGHEGHATHDFDRESAEHAMIPVGGACGMCKERIETTAKGLDGVFTATWVQSEQQLHLDFDPEKVTLDDVAKALAAVGHDAGDHTADQAIYDALPACCWYRE
jgi:Cu(I)/Ag(I) efflux system membrane fusion protein